MQFNQVNKNSGDVNNAIASKGNVVQSSGDRNKVQTTAAKSSFWSQLWSKFVAFWRGSRA